MLQTGRPQHLGGQAILASLVGPSRQLSKENGEDRGVLCDYIVGVICHQVREDTSDDEGCQALREIATVTLPLTLP